MCKYYIDHIHILFGKEKTLLQKCNRVYFFGFIMLKLNIQTINIDT